MRVGWWQALHRPHPSGSRPATSAITKLERTRGRGKGSLTRRSSRVQPCTRIERVCELPVLSQLADAARCRFESCRLSLVLTWRRRV